MKYTFRYEETLMRDVTVDAGDLGEAYEMFKKMLDNEIVVLDSSDFLSAKVSLPCDKNWLPQIERDCEPIPQEEKDLLSIVIDYW